MSSNQTPQIKSPEETQKQAFREIIRSIWSGAVHATIHSAAGGLLVELVGGPLTKFQRRDQQIKLSEEIHSYNLKQGVTDDRIFVHRLLMYSNYSEIFNTNATLRNRRSQLSDYGMLTVTSSASDVHGFIAELDSEALLYGVERPFECRLLPLNGTPTKLLQSQVFREIEFSGQLMTVLSLKPANPAPGDSINEWWVNIA